MAEAQGSPVWLTLMCIVWWYAANIMTVLGNKYLLSHSGFQRPVFLTLSHMSACVVLGLLASAFMPLERLRSSMQFAKVALLGVIFCSTILLGNASLQYLPVSFNQAIGSTTPFFTAVLAYGLQGSKEHTFTYLALVPVIGGVVVASGGEPSFHLLGFLLCMLATAGRALKSVAQSILMTDPSEKLEPMSLLLYMSSVCSVLLIPAVWVMEPTAWSEAVSIYARNKNFLWWMLVNAGLAYMTNLLNFLVTKCTSALTLQVLGNAKGVVAAVVSVMVFHNVVTAQGALGYAITVSGVFLYSASKRQLKLQGSAAKAHAQKDAPIKQRSLSSPRNNAPGSAGDHSPLNEPFLTSNRGTMSPRVFRV